ncbi:unnamed protein product [Adineta steineri]|uniref:Saposin B-type domain-containing protein n=1 Tax=Adineta steineri TaxID=433720 RepID=A0A814XQX1_9BILA|nr:unnamed protein product [Adineta steineri]CAF1312041.1 unnamed protein product [Adineta steineri]CAF3678805.1 unnamed protein product [Adineta steineri]CAF3771692.1 unnamed protein product [Adineta steineri]
MSSRFGYICILFYFLTLYIIITDSRSINEQDSIDNHEVALTIANYQHRFEHSINLKQLHWTLKHRYNKAYCEFCDLVVPVIRLLIEANQTAHIENIVMGFCREFKLIDLDVCIGAVHEYRDAVIAVISLSSYSNKQLCQLVFKCYKQIDYPIITWNVTFPDKPKPLPQPPQPPQVNYQ